MVTIDILLLKPVDYDEIKSYVLNDEKDVGFLFKESAHLWFFLYLFK